VGVLEKLDVVFELYKNRGLVEAMQRGRAGHNPLESGRSGGLYNFLSGEETNLRKERREKIAPKMR
jgi:hypothetical protein